jgi:sulfite reductase alpha subunit-like flavoprotein
MTDDFHHYRPSSYGLSSDSCLGRLTNEQEYDDYIIREDETYPPRHEATALFTFRRRNILESGKEVISETTLNGHIFGEEEESMEDIVKRLQQKGTSSGVLKFDRKEIQQIKDGVKVIVFVLTQVQGAKFGKKEFGRMMASQIAGLTPQRPILIEIEAEEIAEGETLDVF